MSAVLWVPSLNRTSEQPPVSGICYSETGSDVLRGGGVSGLQGIAEDQEKGLKVRSGPPGGSGLQRVGAGAVLDHSPTWSLSMLRLHAVSIAEMRAWKTFKGHKCCWWRWRWVMEADPGDTVALEAGQKQLFLSFLQNQF